MGRGVGVWMGGAILVVGMGVGVAWAGHDLSEDDLRAEMARNRALSAYVERNGLPDVAETHFLADAPPWDDHEVTLYYFGPRKEVSFARAYILGKPDVQIEHYERSISEERVATLERHARLREREAGHTQAAYAEATAPAGDSAVGAGERALGPGERAESAARRAEEAAARVEMAATSAEHAADRTEAVLGRLESAPRTSRRAHKK